MAYNQYTPATTAYVEAAFKEYDTYVNTDVKGIRERLSSDEESIKANTATTNANAATTKANTAAAAASKVNATVNGTTLTVTDNTGKSTSVDTKGEQGTDGASVTSVRMEYTQGDSSTTAPTSGWQDAVPEWETGKHIWQRSVTTIKAADGTTTAQTGDAVLYGVMNSLAEDVEGNTSRITQTADALGVEFTDSGATSTLIRETSEGIEVGKSEDGTTYTGTHTLVGTDAFTIHDKSHNELASFGAEVVKLGGRSANTEIQLCGGAGTLRSKYACIYLDSEYGSGLHTGTIGSLSAPPYANVLTSIQEYSSESGSNTSMKHAIVALQAAAKQGSKYDTSLQLDAREDGLLMLYVGVGSNIYTIPMATVAARLQPLVWKWGEAASGTYSGNETGWWTASAIFNVKVSGPSNHTSYYTVSKGVITTKVSGFWRIKVCITGGSARVYAGVFRGDTEEASGFSGAGYGTAQCEDIIYLSAGSTRTIKEGYESPITKQLGHSQTYCIIEYLGDYSGSHA